MTGQSILNLMEILDQELQLQTGEGDVTRALLAVNAAQDWFETLAAQEPRFQGDTIGTVTSSASTERTAFPAGLLRLDKLQFISPTDSLPKYDLDVIDAVGGHLSNRQWPKNLILTTSPGVPDSYWTDGSYIYWSPLPDATHTFRYYGLVSKTDITASGTFLYSDAAALPFASFAVKIMSIGVGDSSFDVSQLAGETFKPLIRSLSHFQRERAAVPHYRYSHDT
jgi:hypothetical protein